MNIPVLPAHGTATWALDVAPTAYARLNAVTGPGGERSAAIVQLVVPPVARVTQPAATFVEGNALLDFLARLVPGPAADRAARAERAPARPTIKAVWVAIVRLPAGKHHRCPWLRNRKAKFAQRACNRPIWLRASGTKRWRLSYARLPRGRYEVFALALSPAGLSGDNGSRRAGDTRIFRVG